MKKSTGLMMVMLLLASSFIVANNIDIYAATSSIKGDFNNDGLIDNKDLAILKAKILLPSKDIT